jgi:ribosomal protein S27AE
MARRDLHIICGKCGADKDDLTYKISSYPSDENEDVLIFECNIYCDNCGNITGIGEVLEEEL